MTEPLYRPIPGKFTFDLTINAPAKVVGYGSDSSGEFVIVQRAGSYRAKVQLPLTCIRRLTDTERAEVSRDCDRGFW
jgi:hypothetical protein